MLKDKEVVSDPQRQYEIARQLHASQHGGINKTTATIAEKYHWVRIKETVSLVIKNCPDCKESVRPPPTIRSFGDHQSSGSNARLRRDINSSQIQDQNSMIERLVDFTDLEPSNMVNASAHGQHQNIQMQPETQSMAPMTHMHNPLSSPSPYDNMPLDPQIMHGHHQHQDNQFHPSPDQGNAFDQLHHAANDVDGDSNYVLDLASHEHDPDTRMATERHIRRHDEPMAFVHETGEDGGYELGGKLGARSEEERMHEDMVDFEGRNV